MPRRPKRSTEERLDDLEAKFTDISGEVARLTRADAEIESLKEDVTGIRDELAKKGIGPIPNPVRKARKVSVEALSRIRSKNAAKARAAKGVGRGQDRVRTAATKRKLEAEADGSSKKK